MPAAPAAQLQVLDDTCALLLEAIALLHERTIRDYGANVPGQLRVPLELASGRLSWQVRTHARQTKPSHGLCALPASRALRATRARAPASRAPPPAHPRLTRRDFARRHAKWPGPCAGCRSST
jgi:hypothetical protein